MYKALRKNGTVQPTVLASVRDLRVLNMHVKRHIHRIHGSRPVARGDVSRNSFPSQ